MGRQINFYMTNETSHEFIELLKENGFKFLTNKALDIDADYYLPDDTIERDWQMCLYKPEWGRIVPTPLDGTNKHYISQSYNPVIELCRSYVDENKKKVYGGRLWVTSCELHDENADRDQIRREYNRLVRWIKIKVPYIKKTYSYVEDDIIKKVRDEGYDNNRALFG